MSSKVFSTSQDEEEEREVWTEEDQRQLEEGRRKVEELEKKKKRAGANMTPKKKKQKKEEKVPGSTKINLPPEEYIATIKSLKGASSPGHVGFYLTKEFRTDDSDEAITERNARHVKLWKDIKSGLMYLWKKNWTVVNMQVLINDDYTDGERILRRRKVERQADSELTKKQRNDAMDRLPQFVYKFGSVYNADYWGRMSNYFNVKKDAPTVPAAAVRCFGAVWTVELKAYQQKWSTINKKRKYRWELLDLQKNMQVKDKISKIYEFTVHDSFETKYNCMLLNTNGSRNETEEYIFGLAFDDCVKGVNNWLALHTCAKRFPNGTGADTLPGNFEFTSSKWKFLDGFQGGQIAFVGKLVVGETIDFTNAASIEEFQSRGSSSGKKKAVRLLDKLIKLRF